MVVLYKDRRKLYNNNGSLTLTIPASAAAVLEWCADDEVVIEVEEKAKGKFVAVFKE